MTSSDKEYDDLSDLNSMEMESVKEWEAQFRGKNNSFEQGSVSIAAAVNMPAHKS